MQVGTKLTFCTLAFHGRDDFVTDNKTTDIGSTSFLDELLHQDIGFQAHEGFDYAFCRLAGFCQHHANALSALQEFDDHRRATDQFQQLRHVVRLVGESGHRHAYAFARKQLQGPQFVPGAGNGDRFVDRKHTHHLELTQHRRSVKGDRSTDPGNHHIEVFQHFLVVVDQRVRRGNVHGAVKTVNHLHFVTPVDTFLNQAPGGEEVTVSGHDRNFHDKVLG